MLNQVIFPCFLSSNLLNLLTYLSLILRNLSSSTLSMNCCHLSIVEVDIMDASFDLCKSLCLALSSLARNIKESIFIRVNNPTLNRNIGKFNLPHIWDRVLLNTPGLKLKRHAHTFWHVNSNNPNTPN